MPVQQPGKGRPAPGRWQAGDCHMRSIPFARQHKTGAMQKAVNLSMQVFQGRIRGNPNGERGAPAEQVQPIQPQQGRRGGKAFHRLVCGFDLRICKTVAQKGEGDVKVGRIDRARATGGVAQILLQQGQTIADIFRQGQGKKGAHGGRVTGSAGVARVILD